MKDLKVTTCLLSDGIILTRIIQGKSMAEHFKFACAYWHSFNADGSDPLEVVLIYSPGIKSRMLLNAQKIKWTQLLSLCPNSKSHITVFTMLILWIIQITFWIMKKGCKSLLHMHSKTKRNGHSTALGNSKSFQP